MTKTILTTTTTKSSPIPGFFLFFLLFVHKALAVPATFLVVEKHRLQGEIHAYQSSLRSFLKFCGTGLQPGFCAIALNETLQFLSPPEQFGVLKRLEQAIEDFEKSPPTTQEEKLFVEIRLFAYLPKSYGQNFGRSLVALESLKRLKPDYHRELYEFYEKEIRFLQGKAMDGLELTRLEKESVLRRKRAGLFLSLGYLYDQGMSGRLGYEDGALNDGPWGFGVLAHAASRPLYGAIGKIAYGSQEYELNSRLAYERGKENFYGLGADTSLSDFSEFDFQRVDGVLALSYFLNEELTIEVGVKVRDVRLFSPSETKYNLVGPQLQITLDTLDQPERARWGYRVSMYGYFQRFQQFGWEARLAVPLRSTTHANLAAYYEGQFGTIPVFSQLRLGETFPIPGVSRLRYQDRTALGSWLELRQELFSSMGGGIFGSANFIGASIDDSFHHRGLWGAGVFVDWRWTRSPIANVRVELSRFVDTTILQVGVAESF